MIYNEMNNTIFNEIFYQFLKEIEPFNNIYLPVSGGIDSTFIFFKFLEFDIPITGLIWNNTLRSLITARKTLIDIFSYGIPFFITIPIDNPGMITQKTKKIVKEIFSGSRKYNKKSIPCCYYLKEKPFNQFIKKHIDNFDIIVNGIAGYESFQRQIRLGELRNRNTFIRYKKTEKRFFAYPLRDFTKKKHRQYMLNYLSSIDITAKRSGCYTCPIIV